MEWEETEALQRSFFYDCMTRRLEPLEIVLLHFYVNDLLVPDELQQPIMTCCSL